MVDESLCWVSRRSERSVKVLDCVPGARSAAQGRGAQGRRSPRKKELRHGAVCNPDVRIYLSTLWCGGLLRAPTITPQAASVGAKEGKMASSALACLICMELKTAAVSQGVTGFVPCPH